MEVEKKTRKLKGVIPPRRTDSGEMFEAIHRLREFLKKYPGLAEEVMELREQEQQKYHPNGHPAVMVYYSVWLKMPYDAL